MKRFVWTSVLAAVTFLAACGPKDEGTDTETPGEDNPELRLANENPTPLRGYKAINTLVRERIVDNPRFEMLSYVQEPDPMRDSQGGSILPLLGGFQGRGTTMSNQSAIPGAMNMLLWFSVINGLASDLGAHCSTAEGVLPVKAAVKEALSQICNPDNDPSEGLSRIWDLAIRHDAGAAEKENWLLWLGVTTPDAALTGTDARAQLVKDAVLTALFSPEFLAGR